MTTVEVFGDIAYTLAKMNPAQIMAMKAPQTMAERVNELIFKKKEDMLTADETIELERYLALDLLINLAKARAKRLLAS